MARCLSKPKQKKSISAGTGEDVPHPWAAPISLSQAAKNGIPLSVKAMVKLWKTGDGLSD